jgi:hypothetical protein
MKKTIITVCAALMTVAVTTASAGEKAKARPDAKIEAKASSKEFEQMKTLVGKWKGKVDMGQGPVEMESQYRMIAGGTVLEERMFPGTPHEMVTMYYDQNGKLAMTHYCVLGNRPGMKLKSSDAKSIQFDFDATCGIDAKNESHMHAMTLTFEDADTIKVSCKGIMEGKEEPDHVTTLKRVKS